MKRRSFLRGGLVSLGTITFVSFLYPLSKFLSLPGVEAKGKKVSLLVSEVPPGASRDLVFNDAPVVVINRPGKGLVAFSKVCTHLGCIVEYDGRGRFLCPCHAGTYDIDGNVLAGPPPRSLPKLPLKVEGENIIIG